MTVKHHTLAVERAGSATEGALFTDVDKAATASTVDGARPALLACPIAVGVGGSGLSLTGKTGQGSESFGTVNPLQHLS